MTGGMLKEKNFQSQEKLLSDALSIVKEQGLEMKLNLDKNRLMDALRPASVMLAELRTSLLSPKYYYELYMAISDQLRHLELYLLDEYVKGRKVPDLYEIVQYFGYIVPRLYLLITVGFIYMKTNTKLKSGILRDLVEMCRGVQHPLRGLFLRNYLLQCVRNILPDQPIEGEEPSGATVKDSVDFVLTNFAEMNKLWVRMQHQGHTKERLKREQEREELKLLVGTNLGRLAQLEAIDLEKYCKMVLPGILEQVVSCRDAIAQEYLMECIIQVFPDEFHLETLDPLLKSCIELQSSVNVKNIVICLIDRLEQYSKDKRERVSSLLETLCSQVQSIVHARDYMPPEDIISLQVSLANLALKCFPDEVAYVDNILLSTVQIFEKLKITKVEGNVARELSRLLSIPIQSYNNVLTILELKNFTPLVNLFDLQGRKNISTTLVNSVLNNNTFIPTPEQVNIVLTMISPLVKDGPPEEIVEMDSEDFAEEQGLLGRLIHHLKSDSLDQQYLILTKSRSHFVQGGPKRIRITFPALVFQAYQLALDYSKLKDDEMWEKKCEKILQFCFQCINCLVQADYNELALRLYLHGTLTTGQIRFSSYETIAYEFLSRAFTLYEEEICDSKAKLGALSLIVGSFEQLSCFSEENCEPVRTQCALAASKLLKKPDQARSVATTSHLFWSSKNLEGKEIRDGKKVLDCLNRGVRITNQCMDLSVHTQLLVELFNHYVFFYEKGNNLITIATLNQLISKIKEDLANLESTEETEQIGKHLQNTLEHLRLRMESTETDGISYEGLEL